MKKSILCIAIAMGVLLSSLGMQSVCADVGSLALNKPAEASSHNGNNVPGNAVDSNLGTYWQTGKPGGVGAYEPNPYIIIDFEGMVTFSQLTVREGGRLKSFELHYSISDDDEWVLGYASTLEAVGAMTTTQFRFPDITAKKVKFWIKDSSSLPLAVYDLDFRYYIPELKITSDVYTVDDTEGSISNIPSCDADIEDFMQNISVEELIDVKVYRTYIDSGNPANVELTSGNMVTGDKVVLSLASGVTRVYTVNIGLTDTTIKSPYYTINKTNWTISNVPVSCTSASEFLGNLYNDSYAKFTLYKADGEELATDVQTDYKLKVTSDNGEVEETYTVKKNTAELTTTVPVVNSGHVLISGDIIKAAAGITHSEFRAALLPANGGSYEILDRKGTAVTDGIIRHGYHVVSFAENGASATYTVWEDYARFKTATMNSYEYPDHPPGHAVDGDMSTMWVSRTVVSWLEVDMGGTYVIDSVDITENNDFVTSFTISVSTDGSNFKTVYTGTTITTNGLIATFDPIAARYVKIDIASVSGGTPRFKNVSVYCSAEGMIVLPEVTMDYLSDGAVNVAAAVLNRTDRDESVRMYIATYRYANNVPVINKVDMVEIPLIQAGGQEYIESALTIDTQSDDLLKVFLWNDELCPLTDTVRVTKAP